MKELFPDVVLPLSAPGRRDACVAVGASPDEVLWLTAPESAADGPLFTKGTPVHLHSFRPGPQLDVRPVPARQRPHFVQRTPDGVLFANARQRDEAPNAWVISDSGRAARPLSLGDGLADVRVSAAGKIWAAYFDEGIFGSGEGAPGVVARDGSGRKVWAFDPQKAGTDGIVEVYAFNLSAEDDAWVYFYTQFAIVRWRKNRPTVWQTGVRGARAMAVRETEALLLGDYDDPTSLRVLDLPRRGGRARVKRRLRLRLPAGTDIRSLRTYGAADRLVLWSNQDVMILQRW